MKHKKTLYNWLTNRFLLIIRNEENFAEKRTFSFNYAKIIVFGVTFLTVVFSICFYLSTSILSFLFDPRHKRMETNKKIILLSAKVDSLGFEMEKKDRYINDIKLIMAGVPVQTAVEKVAADPKKKIEPKELSNVSTVDSIFRRQFENNKSLTSKVKPVAELRTDFFMFPPVEGSMVNGFSPGKNFSVELSGYDSQPIKTVTDGTVIYTGWVTNEGYIVVVQHRDNLISVYRKLKVVLKKKGENLKGGEVIGLLSSAGKSQKNPTLKFEIWHKGKPADPNNYIKF
ncbi:MAG: murein hydrolase activator EnvC family protein [Cytophagaceae bacterium]